MTDLEIILVATFWVILFTFALGGKSAAPWVRTKKPQRQAVLDALELKPGARVYDIGCGDGAMLFDLVRKHPTIHATGFEIAVLPYVLALATKLFGGAQYRNVRLKYRDFFGQHFSDADAVFLFLLPPAYPRVVPKLAAELRDDAVVVVEGWPFPGVTVERVIPHGPDTIPLYFYRGAALRAAASSPAKV